MENHEVDELLAQELFEKASKTEGLYWDPEENMSRFTLGSVLHKARLKLGIDDEFDRNWDFIFCPTKDANHDCEVLDHVNEHWDLDAREEVGMQLLHIWTERDPEGYEGRKDGATTVVWLPYKKGDYAKAAAAVLAQVIPEGGDAQ